MKTLFVIWLILSVMLCFSIIGLILFVPKDTYVDIEATPSTWCHIGRELLNKILE